MNKLKAFVTQEIIQEGTFNNRPYRDVYHIPAGLYCTYSQKLRPDGTVYGYFVIFEEPIPATFSTHENFAFYRQSFDTKEQMLAYYEEVHINDELENPLVPIGVMPEYIWKEKRIKALYDAISRYREAGFEPLPKWFDELGRFEIEYESAISST